jgi:hypothetical protein
MAIAKLKGRLNRAVVLLMQASSLAFEMTRLSTGEQTQGMVGQAEMSPVVVVVGTQSKRSCFRHRSLVRITRSTNSWHQLSNQRSPTPFCERL